MNTASPFPRNRLGIAGTGCWPEPAVLVNLTAQQLSRAQSQSCPKGTHSHGHLHTQAQDFHFPLPSASLSTGRRAQLPGAVRGSAAVPGFRNSPCLSSPGPSGGGGHGHWLFTASGSEAPGQGGHIQSSQKIPLSPPNSSYLA